MKSEEKRKKRENLDKMTVISKIPPDELKIMDQYFINGGNRTKAVLSVFPTMGENAAAIMGSQILKKQRNKEYIRLRQIEVQEAAAITPYDIAKELKSLAFSNLVDFLGKSEEEIKQLPKQTQRALAKVTIKTRTFTDTKGNVTEETTHIYQLKNSLDAMEKLARHIGFYEVDNRQKAVQKNILNILAQSSPETLNEIEKAMRVIPVNLSESGS